MGDFSDQFKRYEEALAKGEHFDLTSIFETRRILVANASAAKPKDYTAFQIIEEETSSDLQEVEQSTGLLSDPKKEREIASFEIEEDGEGEDRAAWGGKLQFIFTCIGYAVGLGNVWRFPYLCYKNGGGAFLVPYVIMLALVGLPLFFMELAFGQFASLGPITIWRINPLLKGLGYAMVIVSWLIGVYYNVIISHVMLYLFASFASITTGLPWTTCDNWWNTEHCIGPVSSNGTFGNMSDLGNTTDVMDFTTRAVTEIGTLLSNVSSEVNKTLERTPAEEYYNYYVLEMSEGMDDFGTINWKLALCLLLAWLIVLVCLIRGIQSLGKVVYFTAIFPYFMLTVLFIRGVTLEGSLDGIIFYLKPDFARLADPRVWSDAATQIFYSLSACSGGLVAMASYNKFDNNCYKDALIVSLINCATSLYAGFVIFAILGFIAHEKGVLVSDVVDQGPGLAFVVYPEAISHMPLPQLWAIAFFFMMATLGFGSQFSIVECVLSALSDEFAPYLKKKWQSILFRVVIIMATFFLGLPMVTKGGIYLLTLVDYSVSGFPLLFVGLFELVALNYIYTFARFSDNIKLMLGKEPSLFWKGTWMIVSPIIIVATIFFNCLFYKPPDMSGYQYPPWAQTLGWFIALWPIMMIPAYFLYYYCRHDGFELMKKLMKPLPEWGPANIDDKKRYYASMATRPLTPDATKQTKFFDDGDDVKPARKSAADANVAWNKHIDAERSPRPAKKEMDSSAKSDSEEKPKKKNKMLRVHINNSNFDKSNDV